LSFAKTELKPIFEEEANLYRVVLARAALPQDNLLPSGLSFYNTMGEVVIDGQKVFRLSLNKETGDWTAKFFKAFVGALPSFQGSSPSLAVAANERTLQRKEEEALNFLKRTIKRFSRLPLAVSFSGGKDSLVTLALTKLVSSRFDAIFLNTTVEFEETVSFVRETAKLLGVNLIEAIPPHNFFDLCEELGPPSTRMKWCCKTQKFSPQNQLINELYSNGVLVISGIRKAESNIRSRFNKVQRNKMIPKQVLAFPILDWSSLDVWLYLLWKNIPHNKMYDYGFARIGCWVCPEKSLRDFKLVETFRPGLSERLGQMLKNYAMRSGIESPEAWVQSGNWRSRKTKWSKTTICKSSQPCSLDDETVYAFAEGPHLTRVREFMKVFGQPITKGPMMRIHNPKIEITLIGNKMRTKLNDSSILPVFEKQLSRALNCIGCGACVGVCDFSALKVDSGQIRIGEQCTGCLRCVTSNGIRMSCVSVNYKPEVLVVA
jgi:phosphoadenosine phosphosulfate reductase